MTTPIIVICGNAGSGKDTAAEMLIRNRNGVILALADPMKRFVQQAFGFSSDQLWGPSSSRNAPDLRFTPDSVGAANWELTRSRVIWGNVGCRWLSDIEVPLEMGLHPLWNWFDKLRSDFKDTTLSPRIVLQSLGTQYGRNLKRDIWVNLAIKTAEELLCGGFRYERETGLIADHKASCDLVVITDGRFRSELFAFSKIGAKTLRLVNPEEKEAVGIVGHASESEMKGIPDSWFDCVHTNDKKKGLEDLNKAMDNFREWAFT